DTQLHGGRAIEDRERALAEEILTFGTLIRRDLGGVLVGEHVVQTARGGDVELREEAVRLAVLAAAPWRSDWVERRVSRTCGPYKGAGLQQVSGFLVGSAPLHDAGDRQAIEQVLGQDTEVVALEPLAALHLARPGRAAPEITAREAIGAQH